MVKRNASYWFSMFKFLAIIKYVEFSGVQNKDYMSPMIIIFVPENNTWETIPYKVLQYCEENNLHFHSWLFVNVLKNKICTLLYRNCRWHCTS